mmetsp:Transcript_34202/g.42218  ORF Transcript_34202/g.42218 Transcript_34202/m.42218 type:complete len:216 (-) Transcript_34202:80-727(-)
MNDSTAWVIASIPVAAVIPFGSDTRSSGSRIANFGIRRMSPIINFVSSSTSVTTAPKVVSDPVPAVVGIAIKGGIFFLTLNAPAYSLIGLGFAIYAPTTLAVSIEDPPPNAIIPSQFPSMYAFTPSITTFTVGSGRTLSYSVNCNPSLRSDSTTGSRTPSCTNISSVTIIGRRIPKSFAIDPTRPALPEPSTTFGTNLSKSIDWTAFVANIVFNL